MLRLEIRIEQKCWWVGEVGGCVRIDFGEKLRRTVSHRGFLLRFLTWAKNRVERRSDIEFPSAAAAEAEAKTLLDYNYNTFELIFPLPSSNWHQIKSWQVS